MNINSGAQVVEANLTRAFVEPISQPSSRCHYATLTPEGFVADERPGSPLIAALGVVALYDPQQASRYKQAHKAPYAVTTFYHGDVFSLNTPVTAIHNFTDRLKTSGDTNDSAAIQAALAVQAADVLRRPQNFYNSRGVVDQRPHILGGIAVFASDTEQTTRMFYMDDVSHEISGALQDETYRRLRTRSNRASLALDNYVYNAVASNTMPQKVAGVAALAIAQHLPNAQELPVALEQEYSLAA